MQRTYIRNFCILAHIDHGKSTLADRFLEITGTVEKRKMREQFLDMHPLEREKGITIKMAPVRMNYALNANLYALNLIDTPGHVDFSYEVSRALAAVEGAALLVDATQGIQAQTIANLHLAKNQGLSLIPVVNKIDLPSAETERTEKEIASLLDISPDDIFRISAKDGTGVEQLLEGIIAKVPPPSPAKESHGEQNPLKGREGEQYSEPLRALVFDSVFDPYRGIIAYVRIMGGCVRRGDRIRFLASGAEAEAQEAGYFLPDRTPAAQLTAGEIGYIATGFKEPEKVKAGDTITRNIDMLKYRVEALAGYREPEPMVYGSFFPSNSDEYELLRASLEKLKLNDAALSFQPEDAFSSLGRGMRIGFLGMLHMEITAERLKREYGIDTIMANPSVAFKVRTRRGKEEFVHSAAKMPHPQEITAMEEPWVKAEIISPTAYLGAITSLIHEHEGTITDTSTFSADSLFIELEAPLREIIVDFHDALKSATHGFASISYAFGGYRRGDLVRLDILVAGDLVPAFSEIVSRHGVLRLARERVEKLKALIPRKLFAVAIQAEMEGQIVARETIPASRKDVTGYLYGGDRTRKMKLWARQKKGKARLKERGKAEIPPEVFFKMFKR